jgi:hypothetical protein
MWQLLAIAAAATGQSDGVTVDGVAFGPRLSMTCTWFTNFENSRFETCQAAGRNLLPLDEGAAVKCQGDACARLDAEARKAANWKRQEPPWGTFRVTLVGRVSLHRREKRHLGDARSDVLVEKVVRVRKVR